MQPRNDNTIATCPVCGQAEGQAASPRGDGPFCIGCAHPLPPKEDGMRKRVVSLGEKSTRSSVSAGVGPESYAVVMEKAMSSIWEAGGLRPSDAMATNKKSETVLAASSEFASATLDSAVDRTADFAAVEPWAARRPAKKTVGIAEPEPAPKASLAKAAATSVGFYRESGSETLRGDGAAVARALHKKKIALPGEREQEQKKLFVHGAYARSIDQGDASATKPWSTNRRKFAIFGCVFLLAGLASQLALSYRSELASKSPVAQTMLEAACAQLHCTVGRAKAIAEVELEAAQVQVDSKGRLEFSGVLKSKAGYESEAPKLWLAIEGADGVQIAAKIFEPSEWLGAKTLAPRAEIESRMLLESMGESSGFKASLVWGS